jgi:hypothetical protein
MALFPLGILSAAGAGGAPFSSDYELISSTILGSSQPSVTFSSLGDYSSTYKHLQMRWVARGDNGSAGLGAFSRLNGDSGNNYNWHYLNGNGSTVASSNPGGSVTRALTGVFPAASSTANAFGVGIVDLLDAYSTTKNKTFRDLSGNASSSFNLIDVDSGLWRNTASVTSWEIFAEAGNFVSGSRFSLYGIKG